MNSGNYPASRIRCPTGGIGSEFGLVPALLRSHSPATKTPIRPGYQAWLSSGRAAILWALQVLRQSNPTRGTCLLPGYLCPSIIQTLKVAGLNIVFYNVDRNLQVDLDDLRQRIKPDVLAIVVIHYFGFPQSEAVFDLVESATPPIHIIEDATHAWLSGFMDEQPSSGCGRVTIYSPRKFFPVPDCGIAVFRDLESPDIVTADSPDWNFTLQRTVGLLLRRIFAQTGLTPVNRMAFSLLRSAERKLDTTILIRSTSWISRRILRNLDYETASKRRRQNFATLNEGLKDSLVSIHPLYKDLPARITPLGLPVVCERRDAVRQFLIGRRVYPPIHWLLSKGQNIIDFPHLVDLSEHILTLPIDQRYGTEEMEYILDCLQEWERTA